MLTAILVGGKVASGITAELGSMKVTEQIDALRTLGVNFIKRLIVPRVLAALLVFPLLTVMADVLGVLGGMVIMFLERGTDMWAYWNTTTYWVVPRDFLMGVGKSFFFGAIVTLIGCYNGLSTDRRHRGAGAGHDGDRRALYDGRDHLRLLPDQAHADALLVSAWECANRRGRRRRPRPGRSSRSSTCASGSTATRCCAACRSTPGAGETLVIMGGSGSGKTVTLRLVAGLIRPDQRPGPRLRRTHRATSARRSCCRSAVAWATSSRGPRSSTR